MTHFEFIKKMSEIKPMHDAWVANGSGKCWEIVADAFSVSTNFARIKIGYYENHKSDPQVAGLGQFSHKSVCECAAYVPLNDVEKLRNILISQCGSHLEFHKAKRCKIPKKILRNVLPLSGLSWFEKRGQPLVHWNHCA